MQSTGAGKIVVRTVGPMCLGKRPRDERDIRKVAMKLAAKLCYPNSQSPEIYPTLGGVGARRGSEEVTDWLTDLLDRLTD
jgi:hypothetical protein